MSQQSKGGFGLAHPTPYAPAPEIKDTPDLSPSDIQPPGVDEEEIDLETALTTL